MKIVEDYLIKLQPFDVYDYQHITYEDYCTAIDLTMSNELTEGFFYGCITEGFFDNIKRLSLSREYVRLFRDLKSNVQKIGDEFKLNLTDTVSAFKQKDVFKMLKGFGFNILLVWRSITALTQAIKGGLLGIFREMFKLKIFQKLRSGAMKVDEFLDKYPKLKMVTGFVVAGLLFYIWLNMTFIGDLDYDFNFSDLTNALAGSFSITDLFVSPEGLMLMTLFGTGAVLGLSIPWLGKSVFNLTLAIVYTGYARLKGKDKNWKQTLERFKKKMRKDKLK